MVDKCFSRFGKGNATSPSFQEQDLPCSLHITQAFARGWKRQSDFSRTVGDAAGIGDGEEQAEVGKIKTHKQW